MTWVAAVEVEAGRGGVQHTWPRLQNLLRLKTPAPSVMMSPSRQRLLDTQVQLVVEVPGTTQPTYLSRSGNMSGSERKVRVGHHHYHPWSQHLLLLLLPTDTVLNTAGKISARVPKGPTW